jgi:hypothetical protein
LVARGEPAKIIARVILRLSLAVLLATGTRVALADAASLGDWLAGSAATSGLPALLDPITSAGRKAWDCTPERVASTPRVDEAGLPR